MPEALERALRARAREHGLKPRTDRYNAFVYGTLAKVKARQEHHQSMREASKKLKEGKNV